MTSLSGCLSFKRQNKSWKTPNGSLGNKMQQTNDLLLCFYGFLNALSCPKVNTNFNKASQVNNTSVNVTRYSQKLASWYFLDISLYFEP